MQQADNDDGINGDKVISSAIGKNNMLRPTRDGVSNVDGEGCEVWRSMVQAATATDGVATTDTVNEPTLF